MDKDLTKKYHVAMLKVCDEIRDPFLEFTADIPKVGERVKPSDFFGYDIKYKLDVVPYKCSCTLDEIKSTAWLLDSVLYGEDYTTLGFKSVDKIRGSRRIIKYKGYYSLTGEVAEIPENVMLIKQYKAGVYTLLELLRIFRDHGYYCKIAMRHLFYSMTGDQYLEAMEEILKENESNV